MLDFITENYWLILYIGFSWLFVVDFAAKTERTLGPLAVIFVLILAPLWPLFLLFFLFRKG